MQKDQAHEHLSKKDWKKSFSIHGMLILIAFVYQLIIYLWNGGWWRKSKIIYASKSVRVDVVAMPTHTLEELKRLQNLKNLLDKQKKSKKAKTPKKTKKEVAKKTEKKATKKKAPKVQAKKTLLKGTGKKSKAQTKESKSNEEYDENLVKALEGLVLAGNKLNKKGQDIVGNSSGANATELGRYAGKIVERVRPFWRLPAYLMDKELNCRIRVYIASSGKLMKANVDESSGDSDFDQRALKAIRQVGNFPAPEKKIARDVLNGNIVLGFPL